MNFGLLMVIRNPPKWPRKDHDVYEAYINRAVRGEELGFAHTWTSEHHFSDGGWSPSQFPILAAIAARTSKIRLGTYVLLVPIHNPIRAAEDAATVDIISNGRLELGAGAGGRPLEHHTFNVPFKERKPRMFEGLEVMKKCFDEEIFSFKGKYWDFKDVRMTTKPVQRPLPIWVAAIGPKALEDAGSKGYHLAGGVPSAEALEIYENALTKAGHDPRKFKRATMIIGHLADSDQKAWDEAEPHIQYYIDWQIDMNRQTRELGLMNNVETEARQTVPPLGEIRKNRLGPYGPSYVGSPDTVIKLIEEYLKGGSKPTEILWCMGLPGQDPKQADRSVELFAKEVMPHFKNR